MKLAKEEVIKGLQYLQQCNDTENAHINADYLLLAFIGDEDITKEFSNINRWYS